MAILNGSVIANSLREMANSLQGDELRSLPERVILEMEEPFSNFYDALATADEIEADPSDLIHQMLFYVSESYRADSGLKALYNEILDLHHQGDFIQDGIIIANAASAFGKELFNELSVMGAYTSDGELHYKLDFIHRDNALVLKKLPYAHSEYY
jgi:hypothetical protein